MSLALIAATDQVGMQSTPATDQSNLERRVRLFIAATRPQFARICVQTECGTVRLSGQVASFYLRQLAIGAARRVAGVQRIIDEIEVSPTTQVAR